MSLSLQISSAVFAHRDTLTTNICLTRGVGHSWLSLSHLQVHTTNSPRLLLMVSENDHPLVVEETVVLVRLYYHAEFLPSGDRLFEVQPQRDLGIVVAKCHQTCEFQFSQTGQLVFLQDFCQSSVQFV
jgi:hypothetical protein